MSDGIGMICEPRHSAHVDAIRQGLVGLGFARKDADLWAETWGCQSSPQVAIEELVAFDGLGISTATAAAWHEAGFYAKEAIGWLRGGFTVAQADHVVERVGMFTSYEWLDTRLPAAAVIAFVNAGVAPDEVEVWMRLDPEDRADRLAMLAALNPQTAVHAPLRAAASLPGSPR